MPPRPQRYSNHPPLLAKQPHGAGIPRRICSFCQPSPISLVLRQQDPARLAKRSRRIGPLPYLRESQIQIDYHCRSIGEILQLRTKVNKLQSGGGMREPSSSPAPFCRLMKLTPFTTSKGASTSSEGRERSASFSNNGFPLHTRPTRSPSSGKRAAQYLIRFAGACR